MLLIQQTIVRDADKSKDVSPRVSKNYKIHHQKNLSPTMTLTFDLWHWHKCTKFAWDSSKVVKFWVYSSYIWTPACTDISQGYSYFHISLHNFVGKVIITMWSLSINIRVNAKQIKQTEITLTCKQE